VRRGSVSDRAVGSASAKRPSHATSQLRPHDAHRKYSRRRSALENSSHSDDGISHVGQVAGTWLDTQIGNSEAPRERCTVQPETWRLRWCSILLHARRRSGRLHGRGIGRCRRFFRGPFPSSQHKRLNSLTMEQFAFPVFVEASAIAVSGGHESQRSSRLRCAGVPYCTVRFHEDQFSDAVVCAKGTRLSWLLHTEGSTVAWLFHFSSGLPARSGCRGISREGASHS